MRDERAASGVESVKPAAAGPGGGPVDLRTWAKHNAPFVVACIGIGLWAAYTSWSEGRSRARQTADASRAVHTQNDYAAAIRAVLDRLERCDRDMVDSIRRQQAAGVDIEEAIDRGRGEYLHAVGAIDLTACPPDFQEAVLRFYQAFAENRELAQQYKGFTGALGGLMEYVETRRNPADRFRQSQERINERVLQVNLVALRYGVQHQAERK